MQDVISRQAAIDIVRHECGEWTGLAKEIAKQFNELPSAQPEYEPVTAEVCDMQKDDVIYRQAAIDAIRKLPNAEVHWLVSAEAVFDVLLKLPSAQPKAIRPKFVAEDRYLKNHFQTFPHCPKCNHEVETGDCYCRVCGCRIDWSEDDE